MITIASHLQITGLSAGYRQRPVLSDLTLAPIEPGRVTALVGPNGAGKSTLLRALAGLLPARGSVRLGTEELLGLPLADYAGRVTYMPQALPQRVALTVLEAVIGALRASPVSGWATSSRAIRERALATLDRVGIAELAMEPLDSLSGGQRQLASLAQAVVREPRLLLLDEPTSALDLRHQAVVMRLVRELAMEGRIAMVVMHDLDLAVRWAEHVVVLDGGRAFAEGPPESAITPISLAHVYGVHARVERCTRGRLRVVVDGPLDEPHVGCEMQCRRCAV